MVKVKLEARALTGAQHEGLRLAQQFGSHVSALVVDAVEAHREILVVDRRPVVGDIGNDAVAVGGNDAVILVGDVEDAVGHVERGSRHGRDGDPLGVKDGRAALLERERDGLGARCGGREAVNDVPSLTFAQVGESHACELTVDKHVNHVVGRCARVGEVEVHHHGFAMVEGALDTAAVHRVGGCAASIAIAPDGARIGIVDGHLDVIHV